MHPDEDIRRGLHCGFIPRERWTPGPPKIGQGLLGPSPWPLDICPGWVVRDPRVIDGAAAAAALQGGYYEIFDPELDNATFELAQEIMRAFKLREQSELKALAKK